MLGLQGQLWTEHIRTEERVDHMAFPRAAAIAELGWSARAPRLARLPAPGVAQQPRYAALGVEAADSALRAARHGALRPDGRAVTLANQAEHGEIRYTTDGSAPTPRSARYDKPLPCPRAARCASRHSTASARSRERAAVVAARPLASRRAARS